MEPAASAARGSLGLRLLAFAGLSIAVALVLAWVVLGTLFERHAERQLESELERHGIALVAALSLDPQGVPQLERYPADPRFDRPASGLYWLLISPDGELRSRSLWDGRIAVSQASDAAQWVIGDRAGPYEAEIMVATRSVQVDPNGPPVRVIVAADRAPLTAARGEFERETALFLSALWALLALAAWVQVKLGLRPLVRISAELEGMSRSAEARLDVAAHPTEIRPLTAAINRVADQRAGDIVRARKRAKDLAHALKTPLTALRLQLGGLEPEVARDMAHSLALVSGAVEGELARTGLKDGAGTSDARMVVERIVAVVSRTPAGQNIALRNEVPADLQLPMSDDTALETFGALIENAVRHASAAVKITGGSGEGLRWIIIADDGAGIPLGLRESALARGARLDERSGSHGLGLSIAHDFVAASGGTLTLENADGGGLAVHLTWQATD